MYPELQVFQMWYWIQNPNVIKTFYKRYINKSWIWSTLTDVFFRLRLLTAKKHPQVKLKRINMKKYKKHEYRRLGSWYIKSTIYNKGISGKTLFFVKGQFCTPYFFFCFTISFWQFYCNVAFSIVVPSSKKQYITSWVV